MTIFSLFGIISSLLYPTTVPTRSMRPARQERLVILCTDIEDDWNHMLDDPLHTLSHEQSAPVVAPKASVDHFNNNKQCGSLDGWDCYTLNNAYNLYIPPEYPIDNFNLKARIVGNGNELPLAELTKILNTKAAWDQASWDIMLLGHGHVDYAVCGIPIQKFKPFLRWCERINAKSLHYLTCFGAGINTEKIYTTFWEPETYNFMIINGSCIDNITYPFQGFATYFDTMGTLDGTGSYQEIANACRDTLYSPCDDTAINFPQVRYPHAEAFIFDTHAHETITLQKASCSIDQTQLGSTEDIIFDQVTIDSLTVNNPQYIRSAVPGSTIHYCGSMNTLNPIVTIETIGQAFFKNIGEPYYGKMYCFERIECVDNKLYTDVVVLIQHCLLPKKPKTILWYTEGETSYKLLPQQSAKQLSRKEYAEYRNAWAPVYA